MMQQIMKTRKQFYKLSYNRKYTKAIKKLTKICGLFRKEAETKSFFYFIFRINT